MSFTVSRQTREIGVRIALGADRRRIFAGVFSRAAVQLGLGIGIGALAAGALWGPFLDSAAQLVASMAVLAFVGLLSCGAPVRRALRIEPSEALRDAG
jgi:ABC-type antimicrobial peptide transport system permease subunit